MTDVPLRRLRGFWNYLPAFRVVAETQHLPTAARTLALSPPALSRTIRLLEDALGAPLFERRSRALHLTPFGRALRDGLRPAMRAIDELTQPDARPADPTPLRVVCTPDTAWLVPGLAAALATHDVGLRQPAYPADAPAALLRGEVDLVVHGSHRVVDGIALERLGDATWAVYAGARGQRAPRGAAPMNLRQPRMVTAPGDPWPLARPRVVLAEVAALADLPRAARDGALAALLPTPVATSAGLRPLAVAPLRVPVFVSRRPAVAAHHATELALAALRAQLPTPRRATG